MGEVSQRSGVAQSRRAAPTCMVTSPVRHHCILYSFAPTTFDRTDSRGGIPFGVRGDGPGVRRGGWGCFDAFSCRSTPRRILWQLSNDARMEIERRSRPPVRPLYYSQIDLISHCRIYMAYIR